MKYDPKTIPEGINTSREHPLKEFIILVVGLTTVITIVITLLAYSTDFLIQYIPIEKENEWFSEDTFQLNGQEPEDENVAAAEIEQYLQQLIHQLQRTNQQEYQFSISLINDDTPNAFIIPGGHIYVTTGLLENVKSENGLSMVLAHEMGHHYHRHPLRSAGRGIVITLAILIISGTESDGIAQSLISETALLTSLNFSREQEREADTVSIELLRKHYGHTQGATEFFESIHRNPDLDSDTPVFMSTHPGVEERITTLRGTTTSQGQLTPLPEFISLYLENNSETRQ